VCGVLTGFRDELLFERLKFIDVFKMTVSSVLNCVQNIFCNTRTLFVQPLLLYIIVTVVWSECNIFCVFCVHRELVLIYYFCYVCKH